jgi:hypothetical protein
MANLTVKRFDSPDVGYEFESTTAGTYAQPK